MLVISQSLGCLARSVVRRLPCARSRLRPGVTLVELMIAMLILAIVCIGWLEIIGIQSAKREARRREAVERLAGMMDAFMYDKRTSVNEGSWYLTDDSLNFDVFNPKLAFTGTSYNTERHFFPDKLSHKYAGENEYRNLLDLKPICYRMEVVKLSSLLSNKTKNEDLFDGQASSFRGSGSNVGNWMDKKWLIGLLYDSDDTVNDKKPFFRLPVCLGL